MVNFLLVVLAIAGGWVALYVLWFIGELWQGRKLPKLLVQGLVKEFENQRVRRAIESRLRELEAPFEPANRLSDRDRGQLVGYVLSQWILFERRTEGAATARDVKSHDFATVLKDNFRGSFPDTAVITKDWASLVTELAAVLCDEAAKAAQ